MNNERGANVDSLGSHAIFSPEIDGLLRDASTMTPARYGGDQKSVDSLANIAKELATAWYKQYPNVPYLPRETTLGNLWVHAIQHPLYPYTSSMSLGDLRQMMTSLGINTPKTNEWLKRQREVKQDRMNNISGVHSKVYARFYSSPLSATTDNLALVMQAEAWKNEDDAIRKYNDAVHAREIRNPYAERSAQEASSQFLSTANGFRRASNYLKRGRLFSSILSWRKNNWEQLADWLHSKFNQAVSAQESYKLNDYLFLWGIPLPVEIQIYQKLARQILGEDIVQQYVPNPRWVWPDEEKSKV